MGGKIYNVRQDVSSAVGKKTPKPLRVPGRTIFEKRESTTKNQFENLDVLESIIVELFKNLMRISSGLCRFVLSNMTQWLSAQLIISC